MQTLERGRRERGQIDRKGGREEEKGQKRVGRGPGGV